MINDNNEQVQRLVTDKTDFKREIGVFGGVSIIGGIMIGSGIFYLGSYVLERTGMNSGLALICWIVGGVRPELSGYRPLAPIRGSHRAFRLSAGSS